MGAGAGGFGEVVSEVETPAFDKEWDGGNYYIYYSKEEAGGMSGAHLEDFGGGDDIKGQGEDEFWGAGESPESKGIRAGRGGTGVMKEGISDFAGDE